MTDGKTRKQSKDQKRVREIIALDARGILFINLPNIDLSQVITSSLYLLYKAVNNNAIAISDAQKAIVEELSDRAGQLKREAQRLYGEASDFDEEETK